MLLEATRQATQFELISSIHQLEALEPDWRKLWLAAESATCFESPDWLIPWTRHFTAGDLACVAIWRESELVGFVPTFMWLNPEANRRELLLLGSGVSDYTDALVASNQPPDLLREALEWLSRNIVWEMINFEGLRHESPLLRAGVAEPQSVCPVLTLGKSWEETEIPNSQAQNLRYYRRRAERIGEVGCENATESTLPEILEELFTLNSARRRSLAERRVLDDPNIRSFHREAAPRLLRSGLLRMYRLRIRGQTAAVLYAFASHRRTCYYLGGFEQKFSSVSPGTLIIGHAIREAISEGHWYFDFLRGTERYKYLWGARDTETFCLERRR